MSRDGFSYDPQDTQDMSPGGARTRQKSTALHTRNERSAEEGTPERSESLDIRERHCPEDERVESPRAYFLRHRQYLLRGSELNSLIDVGRFRVLPTADLAKYGYAGNRGRMEKHIRSLTGQGLLSDRTIEIPHKKTLRILTLTKTGHRLLKNANQLPDNQAIYHGLRKPREAKHDADLYRLYQKEAARIERSGGRPLRVILDYELKKNLNRDLALLGPDKENEERKREIAEKHGLQVIDGKIPLPDLRIEYQNSEMEVRHMDLELATRDYRPRGLAAKVKAGFALYGRAEDASRLRRVLDEGELTAAILSL